MLDQPRVSSSLAARSLDARVAEILRSFGADPALTTGGTRAVRSPIDGTVIGHVHEASAEAVRARIAEAQAAFARWRATPAPRRGELVRLLGEELRANKEALGELVTIEAGKIVSEGCGEVQEMIDICDFAVGLSRQLYGLTMSSERPEHQLIEQWHPAGILGVITAFNFPVAVWSWNAALALVCGDAVLWKPSEKTPLTAIACATLFDRAAARMGAEAPPGLLAVLPGGPRIWLRCLEGLHAPADQRHQLRLCHAARPGRALRRRRRRRRGLRPPNG